jgi:hypothetical protein
MASKRNARIPRATRVKSGNTSGLPETEEDRRFLRRALNRFLKRTLGEEMARVCRLPYAERRAYVNDMIDWAESCGVKFDKPATGVTR